MLIRKNTKAFKTISEILTACQTRADREKLIRLYITKAGNTIKDRISVEGIQGDTKLFYEMNYQAILNNLKSQNHQLHVSDDTPGIYFFHSTSNKTWDETPFEFDETITKEFASLPELPAVRKKEKAEKYVLSAPPQKAPIKSAKKSKVETSKIIKLREQGPRQPDYKLRHKIIFTDLEKIIARQPTLSKHQLLTYYNDISPHILPYLKDRLLFTRLYSDTINEPVAINVERLFKKDVEHKPDWIQPTPSPFDKDERQMVLCNDKEHLLQFVESGCLQFNTYSYRIKNPELPDYIIIAVDSPDTSLTKAIEVAIEAKIILDGLQLPSFVKTDGLTGLHIYIPLDSKSTFENCKNAAAYICKLIRLKTPNAVSLKESDLHVFGKLTVDYSLNEGVKSIVTPYSLVTGQPLTVATPLLWEEVKDGLRSEDFNHETIFKRIKTVGDPFEGLFRKKVNAVALLERLEDNYSFLF